MSRPRLLFYVQHLLGIGHLVRGARIAAAAAARFEVTVALGGERPPGVDFGAARVVQLPPVKVGPAGFGALLGPDGQALDEAARARRRAALLGLFTEVAPDVLLVEAYPFGRRALRFELLPMLEAATLRRPRPLVACSIRDILQENRASGRDRETVDLVRRFFDLVLVHGDPRVVDLGASFPEAAAIADRLRYTGLVAPPETVDAGAAAGQPAEVVVSVGGGAVGGELIRAALAARPLTRLAAAPWLVLTGPNLPGGPVEDQPGVTRRSFVPDLAARLRQARVSVSQAGYNTVADLLRAPACRAVLVPFVGEGETEQTRRAALMARAGLAVALQPAGLTPASLAEAIDGALAMPQCSMMVDLDGAQRSAELLAAAWAACRPPSHLLA